jgi:hypothetical protein
MPMAIICTNCNGLNAVDGVGMQDKDTAICGWCNKPFKVANAVQSVIPQSGWREIPTPPGQTFAPDLGGPIIE